MKYLLHAIIIILGAIIINLTSMMTYTSFNSSNMASAYYNGCNLGTGRLNITDKTVKTCKEYADSFKKKLDDIDAQMD